MNSLCSSSRISAVSIRARRSSCNSFKNSSRMATVVRANRVNVAAPMELGDKPVYEVRLDGRIAGVGPVAILRPAQGRGQRRGEAGRLEVDVSILSFLAAEDGRIDPWPEDRRAGTRSRSRSHPLGIPWSSMTGRSQAGECAAVFPAGPARIHPEGVL